MPFDEFINVSEKCIHNSCDGFDWLSTRQIESKHNTNKYLQNSQKQVWFTVVQPVRIDVQSGLLVGCVPSIN